MIAQSTQTQKQVVENAIDALARILAKTTWGNIECVGLSVRDVDCPPFIFYRCPGLERLLKDVRVAKGEKIPSFAADYRKLVSKDAVVAEKEEVVEEPVPVAKETKQKKGKREVSNAPKEDFKQPKKILKEKKTVRK
jgi:hypothetical protein